MDLPPNVHRVRAKGRTYFYHQVGRNTDHAGARTALGCDHTDPGFWARIRELNGTGPEDAGSFGAMVTAFRGRVIKARGSLTFIDASPEWTRLAPASQRDYSFYLDKLADILGTKAASSILPSKILDIRDAMVDSPGSANHMLAVGRAVYAWGIPHDYASLNPFREVANLETDDEGHRPWPDWALDFIRDKAWPDLARFVILSTWIGQRESDVVRLGPGARDGGGLWVRPKKTRKKKKAFWVPLLAAAQEALDRWSSEPIVFDLKRRLAPAVIRSTTHFIVSPTGKAYSTTGLRSRWNRWLKTPDGAAFLTAWGKWEQAQRERDGEEDVNAAALRPTLHGLRSTAVVHRRMAGYTDEAVANDIGMSLPMVRRYSRFIDQRAAAETNIVHLEAAQKKRLGSPQRAAPKVLQRAEKD